MLINIYAVYYLKYGRLDYVAMCLHDSLIVDDMNATMILFVTYFSESNLADIKRIYYQKYGKTLKEDCLVSARILTKILENFYFKFSGNRLYFSALQRY